MQRTWFRLMQAPYLMFQFLLAHMSPFWAIDFMSHILQLIFFNFVNTETEKHNIPTVILRHILIFNSILCVLSYSDIQLAFLHRQYCTNFLNMHLLFDTYYMYVFSINSLCKKLTKVINDNHKCIFHQNNHFR